MGDGVYKLHETTAFCVERDICTVMEVTVQISRSTQNAVVSCNLCGTGYLHSNGSNGGSW